MVGKGQKLADITYVERFGERKWSKGREERVGRDKGETDRDRRRQQRQKAASSGKGQNKREKVGGAYLLKGPPHLRIEPGYCLPSSEGDTLCQVPKRWAQFTWITALLLSFLLFFEIIV